jgi:selenocysteine lyase/cysteine desulfurase
MQQYKIHVSPVMHEKVNGIRITPHIYTTLEELDLLVDALNKIA